MTKRVFSVALVLLCACLLLCGCSKGNKYGLSYVPENNNGATKLIGFADDRSILAVNGIMMAEIEDENLTLEEALADGKITFSDVLASAEEDAENEDIEKTVYFDGSAEYTYDDFRLVVLNTPNNKNIYFLPLDMNYYSVAG